VCKFLMYETRWMKKEGKLNHRFYTLKSHTM
jgi:hypothetical protein